MSYRRIWGLFLAMLASAPSIALSAAQTELPEEVGLAVRYGYTSDENFLPDRHRVAEIASLLARIRRQYPAVSGITDREFPHVGQPIALWLQPALQATVRDWVRRHRADGDDVAISLRETETLEVFLKLHGGALVARCRDGEFLDLMAVFDEAAPRDYLKLERRLQQRPEVRSASAPMALFPRPAGPNLTRYNIAVERQPSGQWRALFKSADITGAKRQEYWFFVADSLRADLVGRHLWTADGTDAGRTEGSVPWNIYLPPSYPEEATAAPERR